MMAHKKRSIIVVIMLLCSIIFTAPSHVFAATIGDVLSEPENGWERYDESDARIQYTGTWDKVATSAAHKGYYTYTLTPSSSISFKFSGTKLRIIANVRSANRPSIVNINIDGTSETFSELTNKGSNIEQVLVYEKKGLTLGNHTVTITSNQPSSSIALTLDAIEIDNTGSLIDQNQTINLNAEPGDSQVVLSWESIKDASGYNIKRSIVKGGPYEVLSLTTTSSGSIMTCTDTGLTNGTTYYYVVSSIVDGKESINSKEVTAIPSGASISSNSILHIYLDNGSIKEFNLTGSELDVFLNWYDNRSEGTGKAYYVFAIKGTVSPFKSINTYIPYNKILNFDVKAYEE